MPGCVNYPWRSLVGKIFERACPPGYLWYFRQNTVGIDSIGKNPSLRHQDGKSKSLISPNHRLIFRGKDVIDPGFSSGFLLCLLESALLLSSFFTAYISSCAVIVPDARLRAQESLVISCFRPRYRKRRLGKRTAFQWSRLKLASSAKALEAEPAVAHGFFLPPSLALLHTSRVYTDDTPARRWRP